MELALVEKVEKMEEITHQELSEEEGISESGVAKPDGQNKKYEVDTVDIDTNPDICVYLPFVPGVVWTI